MTSELKDLENLQSFETRIQNEAPNVDSAQSEFADTGEWMRRTYRKLHRIAVSQMSFERKGHTLSATSLIHEVFLRLRSKDASDWISERQFLAIVASEMKRVLIDAARRKKSIKRGGGQMKLAIDESQASQAVADSVVELNQAIEEFEKIEPEKAELVRLRYFLGLTETEAASTLQISRATASRHWAFARAWLLDYLSS